MGSSASGEAASSLSDLDASASTEEAAAPGTEASASTGDNGAQEIEMTPIDKAPSSESEPSKTIAKLEEREATSKPDEGNQNDPVDGKVTKAERSLDEEEKARAREQINLRKEAKQSRAQALTMGTGFAQGAGNITQQHFIREQATRDQASKTLQTAAQAASTSTQVAQRFYGDIQSAVQAVAQTMDLVNQTVVASSRI